MLPGHQRIKWLRNIAENFNRLSRVHERYRQTDRRQTDGRTTTYSEHEHEFTFAKNRKENFQFKTTVTEALCVRAKRLFTTFAESSPMFVFFQFLLGNACIGTGNLVHSLRLLIKIIFSELRVFKSKQ